MSNRDVISVVTIPGPNDKQSHRKLSDGSGYLVESDLSRVSNAMLMSSSLSSILINPLTRTCVGPPMEIPPIEISRCMRNVVIVAGSRCARLEKPINGTQIYMSCLKVTDLMIVCTTLPNRSTLYFVIKEITYSLTHLF